ncbi:hypothetical protein EMPS_08019 [Entomortierella parvispora]|uniref:Arrestin-like N-terminal domain-containing protein n=1 Tax=Entomortierella parvispora TaxID=205924 RepID=A0A9P3HFJ1_9FUNG|nr:hypothetical protein EMPS_08019 [Entomortierella parvispora]
MAPISGKEKSLSIHIDTPHVGPNGMPLIYGSTPEKAGSFKGVVRFASNYDCKGRDIVILYEGKAVAQWTALENKKTVNHHTEEVFARQLWYFPLVHTKRSTVAAGVYEKEFQVVFDNPSDANAVSIGAGAGLAPLPRSTVSAVTLLPSSSYGAHARVKYTIRAILRRPFPSVTDVETSQEVWVLHSCLTSPMTVRSLAFSPSFVEITTGNKVGSPLAPVTGRSDRQEERKDRTSAERATDSSSLPPLPPSSSSPPPPRSPSPPPEHQTSGHSSLPSPDSQSRSLLSLSTPSKVLKSAISFLPSIDLSRTRQFLSSPSSSSTPSTPPSSQTADPSCTSAASQDAGIVPNATPAIPGRTADPSTTALSSILPSPKSHRGSGKKSAQHDPKPVWKQQQQQQHAPEQELIEYTGVWEPFQIPYNCSIPSETVHLGQLVPLSIQFGPLPHRPTPAMTPALVSSTSIFHTVIPLSRGSLGSGSGSGSDPALKKRMGPQRGAGSGRKTGTGGRIQKRTSHGRTPTPGRGNEDNQGFSKSTTGSRSRPEVLVNGVRVDPGNDMDKDDDEDDSDRNNGTVLELCEEEPPRFVVKKGILKVMEHTVLREVTVMPGTTAGSTIAAFSPTPPTSTGHRQGASLGHRQSRSSMYQEQLYSTSHPALDTLSNATTPSSSPSLASLSPPWSPSTLLAASGTATTTTAAAASHRPPTISEKSKNFFFKRRSLDQPMVVDSVHFPTASTLNNSGSISVHGNNSSNSNSNCNSSGNGNGNGSSKSTKVISTIEAKFKTEVKVISLTSALRERELHYQEWLAAQSDSSMDDSNEEEGNNDNDGDDEKEISGKRPNRSRGSTSRGSTSSGSSDGSLEDKDASDFSLENEQGIWRTTVWVQLPDASELATCTETKHILRTHTLQLILLCGVLGLPTQANSTRPGSGGGTNTGRRPLFGSTSSSSSSPSIPPRSVQSIGYASSTMPSANKEFRLEMDLHVTGPLAPKESSR